MRDFVGVIRGSKAPLASTTFWRLKTLLHSGLPGGERIGLNDLERGRGSVNVGERKTLLTEDLIKELQTMDTPTVCNALEIISPSEGDMVTPPNL